MKTNQILIILGFLVVLLIIAYFFFAPKAAGQTTTNAQTGGQQQAPEIDTTQFPPPGFGQPSWCFNDWEAQKSISCTQSGGTVKRVGTGCGFGKNRCVYPPTFQ